MRTLLTLYGGLLLVVLMLGMFLWWPIPGRFIHYLRWRAGASGQAVTGDVRSGDTDIHYRTYGSGPPILLLHGGLSHRLSWFSQVPWLVASGRQVILLDTRGHGESGLGATELSYRLFAADAVAVLDHLSIERTDLVGWSDGANTALILAHYWPDRIARVVAISGNSDPSGPTPAAQAYNHESHSAPKYWLKRWWTGAGVRFTELEQRIKRLWRTSPQLQASDLSAITAPILVIIGEHDLVTPEHAQQMAKILLHGTLAVIAGGDHATLISHATQVNRLIGEFLGLPTN